MRQTNNQTESKLGDLAVRNAGNLSASFVHYRLQDLHAIM